LIDNKSSHSLVLFLCHFVSSITLQPLIWRSWRPIQSCFTFRDDSNAPTYVCKKKG